jgi:hypothetical protein
MSNYHFFRLYFIYISSKIKSSKEGVKLMELWLSIVLIVVALLVGAVVGFFLARAWFKKYLEKNPPMNERMIREMMRQMGRTPSEKQVRQIMASMNQYK